MKIRYSLLLLFSFISVLFSSKAANTDAAMRPMISVFGLAPQSGVIGTTVTIIGDDLVGITVTFSGGAVAPVITNNGSALTVQVPTGAITGRITLNRGATSFQTTQNFTVLNVPTYCVPPHPASCLNTRVARTRILSTSLDQLNNCNSATGTSYTVFSSGSGTTTLTAGQQYNIEVTTGGTSNASVGFWADWNLNGTFEASEYTSFGNSNSPNVAFLRSITVPATALAGLTSLRVRAFNGALTSADACSNLANGETNDFLVSIQASAPAPAITAINPIGGRIGDTISVTGLNLTAGVFRFNGTQVTNVVSNTGTVAQLVVPAGTTTGRISVTTPGGTTVSSSDFVLLTATQFVMRNTTFTTCTGTFLSPGFPGNYSNSQNISTLLRPSTPNTQLQLDFTSFNLENNFDFLRIFNGENALAPPLHTGNGFTNIRSPFTVTASNATGALFVQFVSDGADVRPGFQANISCQTVTGPVISGFTPISGAVGATVTLTGLNLQGTGPTQVLFGSIPAVVTATSPTSLTFTVPVGATDGPILVTNSFGSTISSQGFDVINTNPPVITNFSPSSGAAGSTVTIAGSNFSGTPVSVLFTNTFNGQQTVFATIISNLGSRLVVTVPNTAATGRILVRVAGQDALSTENFTILQTPVITSFNPVQGTVGTTVLIQGANLNLGLTSVTIGGVAATILNSGANFIQARVEAGAVTGPITVTTANGTATSAANFIIIEGPTITNFTPTAGIPGAQVTINGANLAGATVFFNGVPAVVQSNTPTQIVAVVPNGATTGRITVTTDDGSVQSAFNFTVQNPPVITSFNPLSGPVGTTVVITGTDITIGGPLPSVRFNGVVATIVSQAFNSITVTVPVGATTGPISITNARGTGTSTTNFTVTVPTTPPTITSFTPTSGSVDALVTINGTNFVSAGVPEIRFSGTLVTTVVSATNNQLVVRVPIGATSGPITVTTPAGVATSTGRFTVVALPTITSFSPSVGSPGTQVTITGTNLTAATSVTFNGTLATIVSNTETEIITTVPALATTGPIRVTTAVGTVLSSTSFQIVAPPTITSVNQSIVSTGQTLTVFGTNFIGATFRIGNITVTPNFNNGSQVSFIVPATATTGFIFATNAVGTDTSANQVIVRTVNDFVIGTPTVTTCNANFFSHAGWSGTNVYGNSLNNTTTILPATSGQFIRVTFLTFNTETNFDFVQIFDGINTSAPQLIPNRGLSGPLGTPFTFASSNPTGALTIRFTSDNSDTRIGFAGVAECFTPIAPLVFSINPITGLPGDIVSINGLNLIGTDNQTRVFFNGGAEGTVVSASNTLIEVRVPNTATTGRLEVLNDRGRVFSAQTFTVDLNPRIISFTPLSGGPESIIDIRTRNTFNLTSATINGVGATIVSNTDTSVQIRVPLNATSGLIRLFTAVGNVSSTEAFTVLPQPVISDFTPSRGLPGTVVTVTGTNFNNSLIFLSGTPITPISRTNTSIVFTIPNGAISGNIVVENTAGRDTSNRAFIVNGVNDIFMSNTPIVTCQANYFTPNHPNNYEPSSFIVQTIRPETPSAKMRITFQSFNFETLYDSVYIFDGEDVNAPVLARLGGTAIPPAVTATNPGGALTIRFTSDLNTERPGFASVLSCVSDVAPTITSFVPDSGSIGQQILVFGTGLAGASLSVNNVNANIIDNTSNTVAIITVPTGATTGRVRATNTIGTGISASNFRVVTGLNYCTPTHSVNCASPLITSAFIPGTSLAQSTISCSGNSYSLFPTFGNTTAELVPGQTFTLQISTNSNAITRVWFDWDRDGLLESTESSLIYATGTTGSVQFLVPSTLTAGTVRMRIRSRSAFSVNDGNSACTNFGNGQALDYNLTVGINNSPSFTSFTPSQGVIGEEVIITGDNLGTTRDLFFNGIAAQFSVTSNTQIRAIVPAGATTGQINLVTQFGSATSASNFVIVERPNILSFAPALGNSGTRVIIRGDFMNTVTSVRFGGVLSSSIRAIDATTLEATVPTAAVTGRIIVTAPAGSDTSETDFVIVALPTIASINPIIGIGGQNIRVTGTNFLNIQSVRIGTTNLSFTPISSTELTFVSPATISGPVTVTNSAGSTTSTQSYSTLGVPTITAATPTTVNTGGTIVVTGTNFSQIEGVTIGGENVVFTVNSPTQLTLTAPLFPITGSITVTNLAPGTAVSTFQITVNGPFASPCSTNLHTTGCTNDNISNVTVNGNDGLVLSNFTACDDNTGLGYSRYLPSAGNTPNFRLGDNYTSEIFVSGNNQFVSVWLDYNRNGIFEVEENIFRSTTTTFIGVPFTFGFRVPATALTGNTVMRVRTTRSIIQTNQSCTTFPFGETEDYVVNINNVPPPTVTAVNPTQGEAGSTAVLTGTNFQFVNTVTFNGAPVAFTRLSDTQIQVTVPNAPGLGEFTVINISNSFATSPSFSVIVPNVASLNAPTGIPTSICSNASGLRVNLSASGTFNFGNQFTVQLSDATGSFLNPTNIGTLFGNIANGAQVNVTIPNSIVTGTGYRYRVVSTNPVSTSPINAANITITASPIVFAGNNLTTCNSEVPFQLTGATPAGGVWSGTGVSPTGEFNPALADFGVNTLTYTVTAGACVSTATRVVTVTNQPPAPSITVQGTTNLCAGDSTTLIAPVADSYLWSTGATTQQIRVGTAGTYTVAITSISSNCFSATSNPVTINVAPSFARPTITPSGATNVCGGSTVTLTSSALTGNLWSTGATTRSITVNATGNYFVRVTQGGCTRFSDTIPVTINPAPLAVITTAPTIAGATFIGSFQNRYYYRTTTNANYTASRTFINNAGGRFASVKSAAENNFLRANVPASSGAFIGFTDEVNEGIFRWEDGSSVTYLNWNPGEPNNSSSSEDFAVMGTNGGWNDVPSTSTFSAFFYLPNPVMAPVANNICSGDTARLRLYNPEPGIRYQMRVGAADLGTAQNGSGDSLTFEVGQLPGSTTVSMLSTNAATSCNTNSAAAINFLVNNGPAAPTIFPLGATSICGTGTVTLQGPAGASAYLWSNGATTRNITVANSGNFTLKIRTGTNQCFSANSNAINVTVGTIPATPTITAIGSLAICTGDSVTLQGPADAANYLWSNGATTRTIVVRTLGSITLRTISAEGCTSAVSPAVTVTSGTVSPTPTITNSRPLTFCQGDSTILTAPAAISYLWSTGATTRSITVRTSGSFTVRTQSTVTNCLSNASAALTVTANPLPARPEITSSAGLTICDGTSTTLSAPTGFASYVWSTGSTNRTITVNAAGNYTVQALNANGCASEASLPATVTVLPAPAAPTVTASGPVRFCAGGSVTLTATGGTNFIWSTGATTASIVVNAAGTYTARAIAANGCTSVVSNASVVIVDTPPAQPSITAGGALTFCQGGSVVLTAPAGFPNYLWSNGATTQSITVNASGTFTVQTQNAQGCRSVASNATTVTVNPLPSTPAITAAGPVDFCQGSSVVLNGPSGATAYIWSNGATTQNITATTSGNFTLRTISADGCTSAVSNAIAVTVTPVPAQPTVTASGSLAFCQGSSVTLTAPAGFANYLWSNGANTRAITVNASGSFTVQTGNTAACLSVASAASVVTVTPVPAQPTVTASGPLAFCQGSSVTLTAPAGFANYLWSNGATTRAITVNASGAFTVQTGNTAACLSVTSAASVVTVTPVPAQPTVMASGPLAFCQGSSVTLTAPAGFANYLWSNGATTREITVNASGSFTVQTGNTAACLSVASAASVVTVTPVPAQPTVTASGPLAFCQGSSVTLTAPAGFANYLWSNGATTRAITVNASGSFTVQTGNTAACLSVASAASVVTVTPVPAQPTVTASGPLAFCQGSSVTLTAPAGFANYLWSNGATTREITVTASGSFTVQTGNTAACLSVASAASVVTVNPIPATPTIANIRPTTFCIGDSTILQGPAGANAYLWSNGATTREITVRNAGNFSLQVISAQGCTSLASIATPVVVNSLPAQPAITASGATTFCDGGSVTLSAPAGASSYLWSTGETTESIVVATSGNFTVVVSNASGCLSPVSSGTAVVVNPAPAQPTITAARPAIFCLGDSAILISPVAIGNRWSTGDTTQRLVLRNNTDVSLRILGANGCFSPSSDTIRVRSISATFTPTIAARGVTTFCQGSGVWLVGPAGLEAYTWSNGATTDSIFVTQSGSYTLQAGGGSCTSAVSNAIVVTVNPAPVQPTITVVGGVTDVCAGTTIQLSAPASSGYVWSTGATTQNISVSASARVWLQVSGANGCLSPTSDTVDIIVRPVTPTPTITNSRPLNFCGGDSTVLTASLADRYLWSTGDTTRSITVRASGSYSVVSTNNGSCSSATSAPTAVVVTPIPSQPTVTASGALAICSGSTVTLTAPAGFANYLWSNGATTRAITVNATGNFSVQVGNNASCLSVASAVNAVVVTPVPAQPTIANSRPLNFCTGDSTVLTAPAGFANYLWSNGATTRSITVRASGNFTVQTGNTAACLSVASAPTAVVVTPIPSQPTVTASGALAICSGSTVTLTAPAGFANYLWSNGATTRAITVNATGNFSVQVGNNASCLSVASAVSAVVVTPSPATPAITAAGATAICAGSNVTINGPAGAAAYLWSNGATTQNITVTAAGNYSLRVISGTCTSQASNVVAVTIAPNPVATITPSATAYCIGDSVTLTGPDGFAAYIWNTGATTRSIRIGTGTNFTLRVVNAQGCTSAVASQVITRNSLPITPSIVRQGSDSLRIAAPLAGLEYIWFRDGVQLAGPRTTRILLAGAGTYTARAINVAGCTSNVSNGLVVVSLAPQILSNAYSELYPNPYTDYTMLYLHNLVGEERVKVVMRDIMGKEVYATEADITNGEAAIKIDANVPMGVYTIQVDTKAGRILRKAIKR